MAVRSAPKGERHLLKSCAVYFPLILFGTLYLMAFSTSVVSSVKEPTSHQPTSVSTAASSSPSQLEQINLNLRTLSSAHRSSDDLHSITMSREVHPESASPPISNSPSSKLSQLLVHSDISSSLPPSNNRPTATTTAAMHDIPPPSPLQVPHGQSAQSPAGWLMLHAGAHVSYKLFALTLQAAAILSSVAMQLTPSPTILSVSKSHSTGDLEPLPYVMLLLSATLWSIYGVLNKDLIIFFPNVVGIFLGIVYVFTYRKHCTHAVNRYCLNFYMKVSVGVVVALGLLTLFGGLHRGTTVVGLSAG
eukprot:GHVS01090872.1.p1 GENE.GHVS01090872.1~~GHVS01090872.1.p1  ORF type:complete len:304 (-),score=51.92 GHVS01090872.1:149-1060(-)